MADQTTLPMTVERHNAMIRTLIDILEGRRVNTSPETRISQAVNYCYCDALLYVEADAAWIDPMIQGYLAQFPGLTRTQTVEEV